MFTRLNRHISVFLAALLGVLVGSVGPGVAQAAYDAVNADKVDGKHAVGAGATVNQRKGKLVATNPTTGRLPNGIIAKAPDSAKLNGYSHASLRFLALPIQAAHVEGGASKFGDGISLPVAGTPSLNISFVVPRDHVADTPLYMDMVFREDSPGACGIYFFTGGITGPDSGQFFNGGWSVLPASGYDGTVAVPAGTGSGHHQTFRWPFSSDPGDVVGFRLTRTPDNAADTCGAVSVHGLMLRY